MGGFLSEKQIVVSFLDKKDTIPQEYIRQLVGEAHSWVHKELKAYCYKSYKNTEEFIEDKFGVDIIYDLVTDCEVKQDGWRPNLLSKILKMEGFLKIDKSLEFMIISTNCPQPYDIYWKVRNVEPEAERRNDIRGQIVKGNSTHKEYSRFRGPHYTECYLVRCNVCVARAKIDVPIKSL